MPFSFTHYLIGRESCSLLHLPLTPLFEAGCQGGDFGFFYPSLRGKNIGKLLHYGDPYLFFSRMAKFCQKDSLALFYALGYLSHYAADITFHPHILSNVRKGRSHATWERAIDGYFLSREGVKEYRIPVKSIADGEKRSTASLLSYAMQRRVTKKGFFLSLTALDLSTRRLTSFISRTLPKGEGEEKREEWESLFASSVRLTCSLLPSFARAAKGEEELEREDFLLDFSGKIF